MFFSSSLLPDSISCLVMFSSASLSETFLCLCRPIWDGADQKPTRSANNDHLYVSNLYVACYLFIIRKKSLEAEFCSRFWGYILELITFEILAAERFRLMGFDNRLIIDCFSNMVNILICCHIGKLCAWVPCPRHWRQILRSLEGSLGFGPHRPVGIFVCIDGKDCEKDALVG